MHDQTDSPAHGSRIELVCLAAIVALGVLLRLYGLGAKSLWLDELVLARSAYGDGTLTSSLGFGAVVHPPGYLLLMRLLEQYVGRADWLVRLPAALFSTVGIVAIWSLGRSLAGRSVGLAAAFLLAVSVFHVQYGQELHTYALFATTSTLLLWSLLYAVRRTVGQGATASSPDAAQGPGEAQRFAGRGRTALRAWWPFGLIALVALYSHYYAVFTVAMTAVMLPIFLLMESGRPLQALWQEKCHRSAWLGYVITMAVVGVLFVPQAIFGLRTSMDYASLRVQSVATGQLTERFDIGPQLLADTFVSFVTARGAGVGESAALLTLLAAFLLLGYLWLFVQPAGPMRRRYGLLALAATVWMLLPLPVIAWLSQRAGESFAARRLIFILPMVVVVQAIGIVGVAGWIDRLFGRIAPAIAASRVRPAWLVTAALLAATAVASTGTLQSYYQRPKQDYRTAAALVRSYAGPNDVVAALGSLTRANVDWYYPNAVVALTSDVRQTLSDYCATKDAVFLIAAPPQASFPENSAAWINENFIEVPLYQISLYYRNCQSDAWYGAGAGDLFEQALAQSITFAGTQRAFNQYRQLSQVTDLPAIKPTLLAEAEQNPQDPEAALRLALHLAAQEDMLAAEEYFRRAEQLDPSNPDVPYLWARALSRSGQLDRARQVIERGLVATADAPLLLRLLIELRMGAAEVPADVQQAITVAQSKLQRRDWQAALADAEALAAQAPNLPQVQLLLGDARAPLNDISGALAAYRAAARLAPENDAAFARIADMLRQQGRLPEARSASLEALARNDRRWENWFALGQVSAAAAATDPQAAAMAESSLQVAVALAPATARAPRLALAEHYKAQDRLSEAVEVLRAAAQASPSDAAIQASLAQLLAAAGQAADAVALQRSLVEKEPGNRAARMALAAALVANGQIGEALAEYETINRQWPDFPFAWVRKGELLSQTGDTSQALAAYETAVRADPQDVNLRFILAYAYRQLGTVEQAIAAFEAALAMDPDREAARRVLEELKAASQ